MTRFAPFLATLVLLALAGCQAVRPTAAGASEGASTGATPVDARATAETRALLNSLHRLTGEATLFGHQDDLAYGVSWRDAPGAALRSDVHDVAGQFPAVFGFDLGGIELPGRTLNVDSVAFDDIRRYASEAYAMGGVVTLSWHLWNPVSGGNSWETTPAVPNILPGGDRHEAFLRQLDAVAGFLGSLRGADGRPIPVIFRPWHEGTGSWFWWGRGHATPADVQALYRMTVEHLRDTRGLHNVLYAYSPHQPESPEEYLSLYPGDAYVDVMGFDEYDALSRPVADTSGVARIRRRLHIVAEAAQAHGKIAAITETGFEGIPDADWWTGQLLPALHADPLTRRIAYVMVWRNAEATKKAGHFYTPYPGQQSAADFVRFTRTPGIWLAADLPNLYR